MKYINDKYIIDLALILLIIWNFRIFILNKSTKNEVKGVIGNIPVFIRILFTLYIDVLMGILILIDGGLDTYLNRFLIMTIVIWSGWIWILFLLYLLKKNKTIYMNCDNVKVDIRLGAWLFLGIMLAFISLSQI